MEINYSIAPPKNLKNPSNPMKKAPFLSHTYPQGAELQQKTGSFCSERSSPSGKIKVKSVSRVLKNYKTSFKKRLFVYSTQFDSPFYKQYTNFLGQLNVTPCSSSPPIDFIFSAEQYQHHLLQKYETDKHVVLMSENSFTNFRQFFKGVDQMMVLTDNHSKIIQIAKGKVTHACSCVEMMNVVLEEQFGVRGLRGKKFEEKMMGKEEEQKKDKVISLDLDESWNTPFKKKKKDRNEVMSPFSPQCSLKSQSFSITNQFNLENLKASPSDSRLFQVLDNKMKNISQADSPKYEQMSEQCNSYMDQSLASSAKSVRSRNSRLIDHYSSKQAQNSKGLLESHKKQLRFCQKQN